MIEQVVEDVANHLDLLLSLQVVIDLTDSLVSHHLLSSISLNSLQVTHDRPYTIAQIVEFSVKLLSLLRIIGSSWTIALASATIRVSNRELCISRTRLSMILSLLAIRVLMWHG